MPKIVKFDDLRVPCDDKDHIRPKFCHEWCVESIEKYIDKLKEIDCTSSNTLISKQFAEAGKAFKQYWKNIGANSSEKCRYCFLYLPRAGALQFSALEDLLRNLCSQFFEELWPDSGNASQPSLLAEKALEAYIGKLDNSSYAQLKNILNTLLSRLKDIRNMMDIG